MPLESSPSFYSTSKWLIMTNPISKTVEEGQENRSPLFLIQDKYHETDAPLILFFALWTRHVLKLPFNEGICAARVARRLKVNGGPACCNQMSERKMDTIVLAWLNTFINNAMPITLGTNLESCGMGNFIPGLFRTVYVISHINQILRCTTHHFLLAVLC